MAEEITLEFLAQQQGRILEELGAAGDDMRLMSAMIQRLDGTVTGVINEVRAEHARFDRLDRKLRQIESAKTT